MIFGVPTFILQTDLATHTVTLPLHVYFVTWSKISLEQSMRHLNNSFRCQDYKISNVKCAKGIMAINNPYFQALI